MSLSPSKNIFQKLKKVINKPYFGNTENQQVKNVVYAHFLCIKKNLYTNNTPKPVYKPMSLDTFGHMCV